MFAKQFWNLESGDGIGMCRDFPAKANLCVACLLMDDTNWLGWSERLQMGVKSSTTEMARGFSQIHQQISNQRNNEKTSTNLLLNMFLAALESSTWGHFLPQHISAPFRPPSDLPGLQWFYCRGQQLSGMICAIRRRNFMTQKSGERWRIPLTFTYMRWIDKIQLGNSNTVMGHLLDPLAQVFCPSIVIKCYQRLIAALGHIGSE